MSDKQVLENNIKLVNLDLTNLTTQIKVLEETIRRLQTGINDTVNRLNDADSIIERVNIELRRLRQDNSVIEGENE